MYAENNPPRVSMLLLWRPALVCFYHWVACSIIITTFVMLKKGKAFFSIIYWLTRIDKPAKLNYSNNDQHHLAGF